MCYDFMSDPRTTPVFLIPYRPSHSTNVFTDDVGVFVKVFVPDFRNSRIKFPYVNSCINSN